MSGEKEINFGRMERERKKGRKKRGGRGAGEGVFFNRNNERKNNSNEDISNNTDLERDWDISNNTDLERDWDNSNNTDLERDWDNSNNTDLARDWDNSNNSDIARDWYAWYWKPGKKLTFPNQRQSEFRTCSTLTSGRIAVGLSSRCW